ncbi:enoyl-CoA hydratase/isomerase family protein [Dermatobacter hominis]|nr:enoyl-CoA hydratase-related protein [Dermatobacter hominis]UDY37734.1 enoyl-CoA hydratase/isomerase family protein [Dermatobacter hominis]
MYECFDVSTSDQVAHLQLKRPDAYNTMVPSFWTELPQIVREIDASGSARAIVISSTGKHFCAGMDLSVFTGGSGIGGSPGVSEEGRKRGYLWMMVQHLQDSLTALEQARMRCSPRCRAAASVVRSTWSPPPTCATARPTRSSASRRSTSA